MAVSFIGRKEELEILESYYNSPKSEMVAVYGRRRVGKTFLLREAMGDRFDFAFSGLYQTSAKIQRAQFQRAINKVTGTKEKTPADWFEAFDNLTDYLKSLKKEKVVVFLDELPWMDTAKSNFLAAFSSFWNGWGNESPMLKLYVCGSATTWMVDRLIGDKGGLYGRISRAIYLAPFSLAETEQFLNEIKGMNYGRKQILDTYMVFGGIPYYLDMLDPGLPLSVNIDKLLFAENAPLKTEYEFLFRSLFKDSENYRKVIEALANRLSGMTREEIAEITKLSGGELSSILKNLSLCDFIRAYSNNGKKERLKIYQLTDMYSLYYLRFVREHTGRDEHFWTNAGHSGQKNAWSGYAFEQVCLQHVRQIKNKLGISGISSDCYAWSCKGFTDGDGTIWNGGQIDLIIDRSDRVMNLCEMKYSGEEFVIDKGYDKTLRSRMALFRRVTKTRKDFRCTFITTYGVKKNSYSSIADNEIIMDDLFVK